LQNSKKKGTLWQEKQGGKMIAKLTGILDEKGPDHLVIDIAGVGFKVFIPLSTFFNIGDMGSEISLSIHTHVREDAITLYGFGTNLERKMFNLLISVNGIGPKLALNILSGMESSALARAITQGAKQELIRIPGLGKKTADRIVVELKEKTVKLLADKETQGPDMPLVELDREDQDVVSALINLGYRPALAERALNKVKIAKPDLKGIEAILKEVLKSFSKTK